jgi:hypothetical protein
MARIRQLLPELKFLPFVLMVILSFNKASSQERINLATGIGIPEFLYGGLRLQLGQIQVGGSVGTFPLDGKEKILSISGDIFIHFAGKSHFSKRRPTYFRTGIVYMKDESPDFIDKYTYLNLRIGRDLNISKKFGFNLDGGIIVELQQERVVLTNDDFSFDFDTPVVPSASFGIFYRL